MPSIDNSYYNSSVAFQITMDNSERRKPSSERTKREKRKAFYSNKNHKGSTSKGKLFTQLRKEQTVRYFNKTLKNKLFTDAASTDNENDVQSNLTTKSDESKYFKNQPSKFTTEFKPTKYDDNSIRGKRQKLKQAKEKFEESKREKILQKEKEAEERMEKQKAWKQKKKQRAEITRLLNKKTSRGQPNMKAQSKALLMKIEQKFGHASSK